MKLIIHCKLKPEDLIYPLPIDQHKYFSVRISSKMSYTFCLIVNWKEYKDMMIPVSYFQFLNPDFDPYLMMTNGFLFLPSMTPMKIVYYVVLQLKVL